MRTTNTTLRRVKLAAFSLLASLVAFLAFTGAANAQRGGEREARPIPSPRYYSGVQYLEAGEFESAAAFYRSELKSAMRIGTQSWIDSICYYAMLGESFYQAGNLNEALTNYNAALSIAVAYPNWLGRVNYAAGVTTQPKGPAPWGPSRRATPLGVFPQKATITIGDKITDERLLKNGVVSEQRSIPIDPLEILRCTALSIRRRSEILGPLAPYDPTSQQILDTFQKRAVAPNHWSIASLDVVWGLALAESDKTESAIKTLTESLVMAGTYDHTLTGTALFELGNLYMKAEKVREAAVCYYEASIAAFYYGDNLLVEESIRNYSNASKALRRNGEDPVVGLAFRWAKSLKNAQTLTASFGLELVEEFIDHGKLNLATSGLNAVEKMMRGGGGLRSSRVADRWNYLNALLFYANGDIADGDQALAKVVDGCKIRSPWALQLLRLDNYVKGGLSSNGALTPRNAADLYEYLLREPSVVDWAARPTEALSIQMIAPPAAYERWFCILMDRDLKDRAFEVAERVRRERFFRTQTYGGRLLSLRYILTADEALTTASLRNARQDLFFQFPELSDSIQESKTLFNELNSIPTVPSEKEVSDHQVSLFERLAVASAKQEAIMRFIAAGRVRIPYVFPPVYSVADVQKRMPEDTAILSFIDAEGETFGFMIGKDNLDAWRIGATNKVASAVAVFLKTIGNTEGTRQIEASALAEAHWKAQGARLREIVLGAQDVEADRFNIVFSKLVVVPDGALWYLPFEALCLPAMASTVQEGEDTEDEIPQEDLKHVLPQENDSDANSENSDDANANAENEEEDDLDAAYTATQDEAAEIEAETASADEDPEAETEDAIELADEEQNAEQDAETNAKTNSKEDVKSASQQAAPAKRKSRSARQREELEAYEASLIPMIQASELTIRYSATVGSALPNALGRNAFVETTVAAGMTYPKEPAELVEAAVDRFAASVSKTEPFRIGSIALPGSIYAARLKRLVVFDEIVGNVWNWEPLIPGKNPAGSRAADWIAAPWGAPRLFVAPALRTHAEDALKNGGDGSELFLPILAMQASGADSMLLSRWRTGGRSAYDLTTDFVKNYEAVPAAEAWKRAALKLMKREVVVEEEPRLRKLGRSEATPTYEQPFWWAGYMLIDSGEAVSAAELERFDEANLQKAQQENALLEGGDVAQQDAPNGQNANGQENGPGARSDQSGANGSDANANGADSNEADASSTEDDENADADEGVVVPSFVNSKKSNEKSGAASKDDKADGKSNAKTDVDPLDLGPKKLSDDNLAAQDEEGDDFFAVDDEENVEEPDANEAGDEKANADEADAKNAKESGKADDKEADDEANEEDLDDGEGISTDDEDVAAEKADSAKSAPKSTSAPSNAKSAPKTSNVKVTPKTEVKAAPKKAVTVKPTVKEPSKSDEKSSDKSGSKTGKVSLKPKK